MVVYPSSDHPYMVVIREADLSCLSARCYLNDNIILFYLLFIKHEKVLKNLKTISFDFVGSSFFPLDSRMESRVETVTAANPRR